MVVFGEGFLYWGIKACIRAKWLYSEKNGCIRAIVVVLGTKWLYSAKSEYTREKVSVLGQKWLFSGKMVVFEQSGFIREKRLYSGKSCCFLAN